MRCEYTLCVYFDKNACLLDTIWMDSGGICGSCITVELPEEYLTKARQAARDRLEGIEQARRRKESPASRAGDGDASL